MGETLLLVGNMDPEVSLDLVSQSAEFVGRFAMQIINGAGHSPHQEQPNAVNNHITKFIRVIEKAEEKKMELPRARMELINSYTAPVENLYKSSTNMLTNSVNTISNLPNKIPSLPRISTSLKVLGFIS